MIIEGIVKKIMVGGIDRYAKIYETQPEKVQIKVIDNIEGTVFYSMCENYKDKENVTFLQIMNKRMDVLRYEALSSPFMKDSLKKYAEIAESDVKNISCFIIKHNGNIHLAFYNGFKNIETIVLSKHLKAMGL